MEAALYDSDDGFFAGVSPARQEGHFVTSPHLSPVFTGLLAVQARDAWHTMDRPDPFVVVDLGAGEGALARGIATAAESDEVFARAQHLVEEVLESPGSSDITGPVDFDALAARARENGLQAWGPTSQRDALMALGYRATLDHMRADQQQREQAGTWRTAIEVYGERGQAAMLVDLAGLGGLKVLALGTAGLPAPRALS